MSFTSWLRNLRSFWHLGTTTRKSRRAARCAPAKRFRPQLEGLEDRVVPSFSPAVSYAAGSNPQTVVTADFNGDGTLDLAVTNYSVNTMSVLLGNAGGTFQSPLPSATGIQPLRLAVGDYNADGKLDVVTANTGDLSVLLGNGNGTFQAPQSVVLPGQFPPGYTGTSAVPQNPMSVAVGDINGDGTLDLAVTAWTTFDQFVVTGSNYYGDYSGYWQTLTNGHVNVLLGNGTGAFPTRGTDLLGSSYPSSVAVADLDGNAGPGRPDVVTGNEDADTVSVLLNDGTGDIRYGADYSTGAYSKPNYAVTVGDVNGDTKADLLVANNRGVGVLLGTGTGTFGAVELYTAGGVPVSLAMADFNADGKPDLVTANSIYPFAGSVSVLLGNGDGTFQFARDYGVGSNASSVAVGDFNGDLFPDVAVTNPYSGSVLVLLNDQSQPWAAPYVSINDVTVTEGNTGTVDATFTVSLSAASGQAVTVHYATGNRTATAGNDYIAASGNVTFTAGQTTRTITVAVIGDRLTEPTERFAVDLSAPTNATIGDGTGFGTILDNEPRISINDVTVSEGNTGTIGADFTVSLSAASDQDVTVHFDTANGSATAGSDYQAASGTLTIPAGQTSGTITVLVNGDRVAEPDESFLVQLTDPTNAVILRATGVGTIVDDEPHLSIDYGPIVVTEGNAGTTDAEFTVRLSAAYDAPVSVNFSTAEGDTEWWYWGWYEPPPAATSDSDFQAAAASTLTFEPGETIKTIPIAVYGDRLGEPAEYFSVNLSDSTSAIIDWGHAVGIIVDDEPYVFIGDASALEGNTGTTPFTFTVTLSAAYDAPLTVDYATADLTAEEAEWYGISSATAGDDYTAASGTLTFAPGETSKTIAVPVNGDTLHESDEYFFVNLSNPNVPINSGQSLVAIYDDDPHLTLDVSDATVTEGNSGTQAATFTVYLSAASDEAVTVDYATADSSATVAGGDYQAVSGTLIFAAGETSKAVIVPVNGDVLNEADETFLVNLSGAANAMIADGQGVATILNDDSVPALSISDVTVTEANAGTVSATFTVNLSAASGQTVTVSYATADGTAHSGSDYLAAAGNLTFAPGETSRTVTVLINGDVLNEVNETFSVNLSNPTNATIADGQGVGSILNDDATPTLTINDVTVTEGNAGTVSATFTVNLSAASGQTVTVSYATADGTATAGSDYVAAAGNLTFAPGETSKTITVQVNGDRIGEQNESFFVVLSNSSNAAITDGTGQGAIMDDEPRISINDVTRKEGNGNTTVFLFTVTLSVAYDVPVTVNYSTSDGTATTGDNDYVATSGTITFAPGETTKTIAVVVKSDKKKEANENFFVDLSDLSSLAVFLDSRGTGTIQNDD
jgi:ribosomal protein L35AE/L33A